MNFLSIELIILLLLKLASAADGRIKAENVTGPMGAYVQGAPRRPRNDGFGDYEKY